MQLLDQQHQFDNNIVRKDNNTHDKNKNEMLSEIVKKRKMRA